MRHAVIKATTYRNAIAHNHCGIIYECATREEAATFVRRDYFTRLEKAIDEIEQYGENTSISLACCNVCIMDNDARAEALIRITTKGNGEEETTTWAIHEMADKSITIDFYSRNKTIVSRQPIVFATAEEAKHYIIDGLNRTNGEERARYADMLRKLNDGDTRIFYYGEPQYKGLQAV